MPAQYRGTSADSLSALPEWRAFFSDPDLVALIDSALAASPDQQIALQRMQAARAAVMAARAPLAPQADAVAGASLRKFGLYTMDGAGNISTEMIDGKLVPVNLPDFLLGVQASWEIDLWGKLRNRRQAAASRYLASLESRRLVQTQLVASISLAYYELLALDASLGILNNTVRLQEQALETVQAQKAAGKVNELAVNQFEAQLLQFRGMRQETELRIFQLENAVNYLAGRYPAPVSRSRADFIQAAPATVSAGRPSDLLERRPDVRQAMQELSAAQGDLNAAKADFYPSLNLSGMLGLQAFRPDLLATLPQSAAYGLLSGLTAPLANRRMLKAGFAYADAAEQEAFYRFQQTLLQAYLEVADHAASIRNLDTLLDLKQQEVEVLSAAIRNSAELFRTGRATYLEVLIAQQNALQAQLEQADLKKQRMQAAVHLYRALGGGWTADPPN